ncbi:hypothetical protein [Kitasatospora purpeofusca]|uniref:hypothetical protein n=1 Tax=Kitasatospora purpeofusca TaxID=67352 RepID=UPI002A5AEDDE|nr:hypothetical protein [Kitasatospora purpeofusca]MDY0814387.1 hypothetical protein [Kitasatospora purpeofusca]
MHAGTFAPPVRPVGGARAVRALLLVLAVLAALVGVSLPAAGPAHAAVPDRWGFAYLDIPNPPPGYVPDPSRQWGSWPTPAANPVKVDQVGTGSYVVHFPLIAGPGGIAHVTAVGRTGSWCQVRGWGTAGTGQDVAVGCYRPGGAPEDTRFTVLYTTSSGVPSPPAGSYGYVFANPTGSVVTQYNSAGGTDTVGPGGTGIWKVWLPGLGQATPVGNLQVTAVDAAAGARCKVADWSPAATGQTVVVACFNAGNAPYNTRWTLSYSEKRAVHGPALPPNSFGYLWFNGGLPPGTNYNSSGAVNTLTGSVPYTVNLPNIAVPSDTAQVTAFGPGPDYCGLATPWGRSAGTVNLFALCFNGSGSPIAARFFTAYTSAF